MRWQPWETPKPEERITVVIGEDQASDPVEISDALRENHLAAWNGLRLELATWQEIELN
jgi:hypothetical protein